MAESFTMANRFFDNKDYPRRFSRHGSLTIREAQLLKRHGYAFNELELGECEPITDGEKQFVLVYRGEHEPVTGAECVWIKYMTRTRQSRRLHTLSGNKPQMEGADDYAENGDQEKRA